MSEEISGMERLIVAGARRTERSSRSKKDDASYHRDHPPGGGRILRGIRCGPTAVSVCIINRFGLR
jgi:hypothetical protein